MKILYNALIHTLLPDRPTASAIAIQDGRILAIGTVQELLEGAPRGSQAEDLEGRVVLPGLTDAHIHLENYARSLLLVNCQTSTRQECLENIAERVRSTAPGEWVLGHGWNHNNWAEGFGDAALLDGIAPHQPVYLTAASLHAAWANSAALRLAGITSSTSDPVGGRLGRLPSGEPDGILFESAMQLVAEVIPQPALASVVQSIGQAQPLLWSMGLTSLHDFDRQTCFAALQILHQNGELGLRVVKSIPVDALQDALDLGLRSGFGDDILRIGSLKIFSDGALGPHTAAMLAPYEDDPHNQGILMVDAEELFDIGRRAVSGGLSLAVHAIGDRANHEVLQGFSQLRGFEQTSLPGGYPSLRHRIEHVQVIHAQDAGKLAALGVAASMQPIHATSDMLMADRFWGRRSALAYAWREQLNQGARLAFGSDAPVESPNPFFGLHAAVTRRRQDGSPGAQGWYPEQRLTLLEALQAFTSGPAYLAGMENRLGRLAPGCLADLIVLAEDPFQADPHQIKDIRPVATMVNGAWVWQAA